MKTTPVTTRTLYLAFGLLIGGAIGSIAMATLPQFASLGLARMAMTPVAVGSSLCSVVLLNGILRRGR